MDWKAEAKNKLRNYEAMTVAVSSLQEEIRELESEYTAIQSARFGDSILKIGNVRSREDALLTNIAYREELKKNLEKTLSWVNTVDNALAVLSAEEKDILVELYISAEKGRLDCLCEKYGCEASSIYRRRDKALKRFTFALYGIDADALSCV